MSLASNQDETAFCHREGAFRRREPSLCHGERAFHQCKGAFCRVERSSREGEHAFRCRECVFRRQQTLFWDVPSAFNESSGLSRWPPRAFGDLPNAPRHLSSAP